MPKDTTELLDALTQEKYRVVAQNETAYAIICAFPLTNGHTMVLPKRIVSNISELTPKESKDFLNLTSKIVLAVKKTTNKDCMLFQNYGIHSSIAHIHFHIIPTDANLRTLYTSCHEVPRKKQETVEVLTKMCDDVKANLE